MNPQDETLSSFERELSDLEKRKKELEEQIAVYKDAKLKKYEGKYAILNDYLLIYFTNILPNNKDVIKGIQTRAYRGNYIVRENTYSLEEIENQDLKFITKEEYEKTIKELLEDIKDTLYNNN